eukprot:gene960-557_t
MPAGSDRIRKDVVLVGGAAPYGYEQKHSAVFSPSPYLGGLVLVCAVIGDVSLVLLKFHIVIYIVGAIAHLLLPFAYIYYYYYYYYFVALRLKTDYHIGSPSYLQTVPAFSDPLEGAAPQQPVRHRHHRSASGRQTPRRQRATSSGERESLTAPTLTLSSSRWPSQVEGGDSKEAEPFASPPSLPLVAPPPPPPGPAHRPSAWSTDVSAPMASTPSPPGQAVPRRTGPRRPRLAGMPPRSPSHSPSPALSPSPSPSPPPPGFLGVKRAQATHERWAGWVCLPTTSVVPVITVSATPARNRWTASSHSSSSSSSSLSPSSLGGPACWLEATQRPATSRSGGIWASLYGSRSLPMALSKTLSPKQVRGLQKRRREYEARDAPEPQHPAATGGAPPVGPPPPPPAPYGGVSNRTGHGQCTRGSPARCPLPLAPEDPPAIPPHHPVYLSPSLANASDYPSPEAVEEAPAGLRLRSPSTFFYPPSGGMTRLRPLRLESLQISRFRARSGLLPGAAAKKKNNVADDPNGAGPPHRGASDAAASPPSPSPISRGRASPEPRREPRGVPPAARPSAPADEAAAQRCNTGEGEAEPSGVARTIHWLHRTAYRDRLVFLVDAVPLHDSLFLRPGALDRSSRRHHRGPRLAVRRCRCGRCHHAVYSIVTEAEAEAAASSPRSATRKTICSSSSSSTGSSGTPISSSRSSVGTWHSGSDAERSRYSSAADYRQELYRLMDGDPEDLVDGEADDEENGAGGTLTRPAAEAAVDPVAAAEGSGPSWALRAAQNILLRGQQLWTRGERDKQVVALGATPAFAMDPRPSSRRHWHFAGRKAGERGVPRHDRGRERGVRTPARRQWQQQHRAGLHGSPASTCRDDAATAVVGPEEAGAPPHSPEAIEADGAPPISTPSSAARPSPKSAWWNDDPLATAAPGAVFNGRTPRRWHRATTRSPHLCAGEQRLVVEALEILHDDITALDYHPELTISRLSLEVRAVRTVLFPTLRAAWRHYCGKEAEAMRRMMVEGHLFPHEDTDSGSCEDDTETPSPSPSPSDGSAHEEHEEEEMEGRRAPRRPASTHAVPVLREILIPSASGAHSYTESVASQLRLLRLYEAGMPPWCVFAGTMPGMIYRRELRLAHVIVENVSPLVSLAVGFWDLTIDPLVQWIDDRLTLRVSLLTTYLLSTLWTIYSSLSLYWVVPMSVVPLLRSLGWLLRLPFSMAFQTIWNGANAVYVLLRVALRLVRLLLIGPFRIMHYGLSTLFLVLQLAFQTVSYTLAVPLTVLRWARSVYQSYGTAPRAAAAATVEVLGKSSSLYAWWWAWVEFWATVASPVTNLVAAVGSVVVHLASAALRREASLRGWYAHQLPFLYHCGVVVADVCVTNLTLLRDCFLPSGDYVLLAATFAGFLYFYWWAFEYLSGELYLPAGTPPSRDSSAQRCCPTSSLLEQTATPAPCSSIPWINLVWQTQLENVCRALHRRPPETQPCAWCAPAGILSPSYFEYIYIYIDIIRNKTGKTPYTMERTVACGADKLLQLFAVLPFLVLFCSCLSYSLFVCLFLNIYIYIAAALSSAWIGLHSLIVVSLPLLSVSTCFSYLFFSHQLTHIIPMSARNQMNDADLQKKRQSIMDVGQKNQLDSIQAEVRHNAEMLTTLRRENKELRTVLQQTMRGQRNINVDEHYQKEEELLHNKLCVLKRSLNAVKGRNNEFTKEIERTIQENAYTMKEGDSTMDEGSTVAQKIRTLENRLDKCLIKYNEIDAIRKTYEVILERLQLEQAGFDLQLNALEKTLASDDKELQDLTSVGADAAKNRDEAKAELAQLKQKLEEQRRQQRKDLEQRRNFVQEKREYLEKKHNVLLIKMAQQEERHERLLNGDRNVKPKKKPQNNNPVFNQEELEKLQKQKESYHRLRDATMGQNIAEVIHKLLERRDNHKNLKKTLADLVASIDAKTKEKARLQRVWDETNQRAGGAMVAPRLTRLTRDQKKNANDDDDDEDLHKNEFADHRLLAERKRENDMIVAEFQHHLHERQDELEDAQREQDALSRMLLDVDGATTANPAGSPSAEPPMLTNLNTSNPNVTGGEEVADGSHPEVSSSATVELLRSCEAKLQLMLEELSPDEIEAATRDILEEKVAIPTTNIRLPQLLPGSTSNNVGTTGSGAPGTTGSDPMGGGDDEESADKAGKHHAKGPQLVDDFPDNEVHDRQELKMMSLAAVEREVKKERQMQQRGKEEGH